MKILIFGWDFPPYFYGNLSKNSYNLLNHLHDKKLGITYVSLYKQSKKPKFLKLINLTDLKQPQNYSDIKNKIEEAEIYANKSSHLLKNIEFDLIHCNNWMAYTAGIKAKKLSGKPLILQVENTVFNRDSEQIEGEYNIEKKAFEIADRIIVTSETLKKIINKKYGISHKIIVVDYDFSIETSKKKTSEINKKTILFAAGETKDKEILYILKAAREILKFEPNTDFLIETSREKLPLLVEKSMDFKIYNKVKFIKAMNEEEICKIFLNSDLVIIPYGSDTYGHLAVKAIKSNIPVITSKNLEISKKLDHMLKANFWETESLVDKAVSVIRSPALNSVLTSNALREAENTNNKKFSDGILSAYMEVGKNW